MMLISEGSEIRLTTAPLTAPGKSTSPCAAPALLTGAMLWACHFPLAWGWLGWVALVPLLTLTRAAATPRRIYWAAYLAGLTFFVPALQFMRVADYRMYATWLMLAFYCAAYFPAALYLIRLLDRRVGLPFCLSVPLVWVGLEWVRSFLMTGFAWYYLGHAQYRILPLIQLADLGGVYAVSFLVAAVNGWLCDLALRMPAWRARFCWQGATSLAYRQWLSGLALAALLVGAVGYGMWRLEQDDFAQGPRVALLQTNVPQSARNDGDFSQMIMQNIALPYLACLADPPVDLIVWPETSYVIEWPKDHRLAHFVDVASALPIEKVDAGALNAAQAMRDHFRHTLTPTFPTRHLLGINTYHLGETGKATRYSSALLVQDDGTPSHRFDKIHRVPFGEYVPLRDWLPFMNTFAPYDSDYSISPGTTMTRFPVGDFRFGALVCFEDSDAYLARQYARTTADGEPVDFLVNMSNDGWFHGTCEHEEHLVVSLFRAIENRRALVRSVNMGISAVIDSNGRILKPQTVRVEPPDEDQPRSAKLARAHKEWETMKLWKNIKKWEDLRPKETFKSWEILPNSEGKYEELTAGDYAKFKQGAGVLTATVPIDRRTSVYSQWGDWLPMGCWGTCLTLLVWARVRNRRPLAVDGLT
jgi:apolipoprotein N-acyltransferase